MSNVWKTARRIKCKAAFGTISKSLVISLEIRKTLIVIKLLVAKKNQTNNRVRI